MITDMTKMLVFVFLSVMTIGCDKEKAQPQKPDCEAITISNEIFYSATKETEFKIVEYNISEDCLEIMLEYGGCNEAEISLIASEDIGESLPLTRYIRFSFDETGECEKLIRSVKRFNIENLIDDYGVNLRIKGLNGDLTYTYILENGQGS